jgi:hypothetical protein
MRDQIVSDSANMATPMSLRMDVHLARLMMADPT